MTRKQALDLIKSKAAQGDLAACTRIYCEHRISREAYDAAVEAGRKFGEFLRTRDAAKPIDVAL